MVKAAGDYCTVTENTDLILQTVAKDLIAAILSGEIRPVEFIAVFQKYMVADGNAFPPVHPWLREIMLHRGKDMLILFVCTAVIPQTINYQFFAFCSFAECKTIQQIFLKWNGKVIGFKSVKGDIDLMQGRGVQQHFLLFAE